jgi:protein-L-isoaspartate(D-aspartate) O-methyltransferase
MTAIDEEMEGARAEMVREIERTTRSLGREIGSGEISPRVLAAMAAVPRHLFVPPEHLSEAYLNRPLPIGYGQTISQPFIVALMSDLARIGPSDTVLEIGTGSGYQGAMLARLAGSVYTIETIEPLAERAQKTFADLGLTNISTRTGDGRLGWPEAAPFDAIIVTAAPEDIPDALLAQLKPGGRLVTPVGGGAQQLIVVEKRDNQSTILREIIPVCFVPLTRPKAPS